MVLSLTGSPRLSMAKIKTISASLGAAAGIALYLFAPTATPLTHAAAVAECNDVTGGNFRSYRLTWVVALRPHWECRDASKPMSKPVDLGWWVSSW